MPATLRALVMASKRPHLFTQNRSAPPDPLASVVTDLGARSGILPQQKIRVLIQRRRILAGDGIDDAQIQPASLDLRLGKCAYRVRASFLPGPNKAVTDQLAEFKLNKIDLQEGAVLECGCVYVVPLQEYLDLPDSISAMANPKSSTGRLDVFTRLITDNSEVFDRVSGGYKGELYAEISPRTFSVKARTGSKLNQIRFRKRTSGQTERISFKLSDRQLKDLHKKYKLVDGDINVRDGLLIRVNLKSVNGDNIIGYRAQRYTDIVDVDEIGACRISEYWEPIYAREDGRLILDPHQFYILASREKVHVPPEVVAEMVPIDPMMGEFRVHYAGFFDPGFGFSPDNGPGSRAVLEVRSHEVPFILQDGQIIGRLVYEQLNEPPEQLYGEDFGSSYQGQGLKLSKHFRD